jgi:hypothetical protein
MASDYININVVIYKRQSNPPDSAIAAANRRTEGSTKAETLPRRPKPHNPDPPFPSKRQQEASGTAHQEHAETKRAQASTAPKVKQVVTGDTESVGKTTDASTALPKRDPDEVVPKPKATPANNLPFHALRLPQTKLRLMKTGKGGELEREFHERLENCRQQEAAKKEDERARRKAFDESIKADRQEARRRHDEDERAYQETMARAAGNAQAEMAFRLEREMRLRREREEAG